MTDSVTMKVGACCDRIMGLISDIAEREKHYAYL